MDHPMVKWTLNPGIGQRQWIHCEANAVLEDLRTGVRVRSKDQAGDRAEDSDRGEDDDDDDYNYDDYDDDNDDEEEEEEEGGGEGAEEEGGVIAAGAAIVAGLGLGVDETDSKVGEVPPFSDDETMENQNQNAEDTETGNQAKDEDNSVDGGEEVVQVVQDPVAPQRSYTCGRCFEGIDSDSTFYRCVGHSCRGAFTRQSWIF